MLICEQVPGDSRLSHDALFCAIYNLRHLYLHVQLYICALYNLYSTNPFHPNIQFAPDKLALSHSNPLSNPLVSATSQTKSQYVFYVCFFLTISQCFLCKHFEEVSKS
jgi:hypothetical protein